MEYDSRLDWHSAELATLLAAGLPRSLENRRTGRALELGCGHGTESLLLGMRGWEVTAIDRSTKAIELANSRLRAATRSEGIRRRVQFQQGDALGYKCPDGRGSFDLVVERLFFSNLNPKTEMSAGHTGTHLAKQRVRFLATVAFALKPKGLLILRGAVTSTWGRVDVQNIGARDANRFSKYFEPWEEIGFEGLVTDPTQTEGALVVTTRNMSVAILERNTVPFR